ncbi:MAG: hypothetical protein SFY32_01795 [Bacteroidota bacterium]|nr:hypothetical protein [Bacteroidota bacterium]
MTTAIPSEIYAVFFKVYGAEQAETISKAFTQTIENIEKKAEIVAKEKKIELKDELSKELATKADLALVKTELKAEDEKTQIWLKVLACIMIVGFATSHPLIVKLIEKLVF